mgnify:FL=1|tara:strand:+ start:214 stop:411 length:198 start_codon:yes stop_codon:yes gene_type:complete
MRIYNKILDIDINLNGKKNGNKWFEVRICGLGLDLNYTPEKGWTRNSFAGKWFKMWLRKRKKENK